MMQKSTYPRFSDNPRLDLRYRRTLTFLQSRVPASARILDIGAPNPFSEILKQHGYQVQNTPPSVDLDFHPEVVRDVDAEVTTSFEIFEHLVAPFNILREIPTKRLICTVPLRVWFDSAYRNPNDPWDRHFHEFEDWQFEWLLEKSGWKIVSLEKWNGPGYRIGIRPLLRLITPRYFAVEAERP